MSSTEPTIGIGNLNIKEWALIILMISLAIVFAAFAIGFAYALMNSPEIILEGTIDIGQFVGVIIGIAMVAVLLVGQKLTSQQVIQAQQSTDAVWLAEDN